MSVGLIVVPPNVMSVVPTGAIGTFCTEGNVQLITETTTVQRKQKHFATSGSSGHSSSYKHMLVLCQDLVTQPSPVASATERL